MQDIIRIIQQRGITQEMHTTIDNTDRTRPLKTEILVGGMGVKNWIIWKFILLFRNCVVYFDHNRLSTLFSLPTLLTFIYEHLRFRLIKVKIKVKFTLNQATKAQRGVEV
jgi:hypothetical protein